MKIGGHTVLDPSGTKFPQLQHSRSCQLLDSNDSKGSFKLAAAARLGSKDSNPAGETLARDTRKKAEFHSEFPVFRMKML
jgi:hypothetical protein